MTVSHLTLEWFNAEVTEFNFATLLKPFGFKWWEYERSGTGPNFSQESTKVSVAPNSGTLALIGLIGRKKSANSGFTVLLFRASAVSQPSLLQSENETPSIMISQC